MSELYESAFRNQIRLENIKVVGIKKKSSINYECYICLENCNSEVSPCDCKVPVHLLCLNTYYQLSGRENCSICDEKIIIFKNESMCDNMIEENNINAYSHSIEERSVSVDTTLFPDNNIIVIPRPRRRTVYCSICDWSSDIICTGVFIIIIIIIIACIMLLFYITSLVSN